MAPELAPSVYYRSHNGISFCIILQCWHYTWLFTHWGQDKIAVIFQTTFSNAFSWMKMHDLRLRFYWNLFLRFKVRINNISGLVQIMAWHWWSDNSLSEPMMFGLLMHICVIWPQWVKKAAFTTRSLDSYHTTLLYQQEIVLDSHAEIHVIC